MQAYFFGDGAVPGPIAEPPRLIVQQRTVVSLLASAFSLDSDSGCVVSANFAVSGWQRYNCCIWRLYWFVSHRINPLLGLIALHFFCNMINLSALILSHENRSANANEGEMFVGTPDSHDDVLHVEIWCWHLWNNRIISNVWFYINFHI